MSFDGKVLNLCKRIPKGRVSTYKEIAKALRTRAYRAVGQALKRNPCSPKVPCHRVVNSDGSLGGYSGRLHSPKKIKLLRKEGVLVKNYKIVGFKKKLFRYHR